MNAIALSSTAPIAPLGGTALAAPSTTAGCAVAGAGTPVVLLHSSLASKSQWTPLVLRLASRYRTLAVDLAGYGDNALPSASSFALDDEVRGVAAHVDRVAGRHARVHVVGHSYGGAVALRYAQQFGARIASVTVFEPVAFGMLDAADPALATFARCVDVVERAMAAHRYHDATAAFVDFWSGEGSYRGLPLPVQSQLARRIVKVPLDYRAARAAPLPADCRSLDVPVLVLGGTRSPAVSQRIVAALSRTLRAGRIAWVDGGHLAPLSHATRVNALIEAFVGACEKQSPACSTRADVTPIARPPRAA